MAQTWFLSAWGSRVHRRVGLVLSDLLNLCCCLMRQYLRHFERVNERGSVVGALSVIDAWTLMRIRKEMQVLVKCILGEGAGALVAEHYQVSWRQKWSFSSSSHPDCRTCIVSFWLWKKTQNIFIHLLSYSQKSGGKNASAITGYQDDLPWKCCSLRMRNKLPGLPGELHPSSHGAWTCRLALD